jgi:outer membrane lipoprotein-sorting protein
MKIASRRLLPAAMVLACARIASAQTADDVIEKHLAALGGRAAIAKLTSRSLAGTMTLSTPGGDVSGTIEIMNQPPNKVRTLTKLDLSSQGVGVVVVEQRFDGTSGYVLDSIRGNRDITGNQLENLKNTVFPSPFLNYKERGVTIDLGEKEKVNGRDAYVLIVKPKSGSISRQFIDAESYLSVRLVLKVDVPEVGEVEQTTEFSDYREVDGVKIPFGIRVTSALQNFSISVTKVEHNVKIDETLFSKPASSK